MKKLKYIFLLLAGLAFYSCEEKTASDLYFDYDAKGTALVNTTIVGSKDFDGFNKNTTKITLNMTDEFDGNEQVSEVKIYARFKKLNGPFTPATGDILVKTITSLPANNVTISLVEMATLFGLNINTINGGDQFLFYSVCKGTDNRVFDPRPYSDGFNLSSAITDGGNTRSKNLKITTAVNCPIPATFGVGNYRLEQVGGPSDPFFGHPQRFLPQNVTLTAVTGTTNRTFKVTYMTFANLDYTFSFVCDFISVPRKKSGVGCTAAGLQWDTDTTPASFSTASDAVINIKMIDDVTDDCGIISPITLKLTKL